VGKWLLAARGMAGTPSGTTFGNIGWDQRLPEKINCNRQALKNHISDCM
jgi:hypothetical protein